MNIAVVGARNHPSKDFVLAVLKTSIIKGDTIVSGEAYGVDSWAKETSFNRSQD